MDDNKFDIIAIQNIFREKELTMGQMISGSKTLYRNAFPKNIVCFNGNIFTPKLGKIWWGDIDLTFSTKVLREICEEEQIELIVLREHDGRFENENIEYTKAKSVAVAVFTPIATQLKIPFVYID